MKVIDELHDKPDLIVLDPPRDGINPKALQKIINFGVDRMVYISCKQQVLQEIWKCYRNRDIKWLRQRQSTNFRTQIMWRRSVCCQRKDK